MITSNPYTPPRANVADVADLGDHDNPQAMKAWAWRGRIGRMRFVAYSVMAYLAYTALILAGGLVVAVSGADATGFIAISVFAWALLVPYLAFVVMLTIRRTHDLGWSGWMCLLAIIPFAGLIWLFKPGTPGPNAYGARPPANTAGVKFVALGAVAMTVVLAIASVIAVPIYQHYLEQDQSTALQNPVN